MNFIADPCLIEARSMEIIAPHLADLNLSAAERKVFSRIIHASGDLDYAKLIRIHPQAVAAGRAALAAGSDLFCDVEMVRTGINRQRLAARGGQVHCLISDAITRSDAERDGISRAIAAMRRFGAQMQDAIVVIGNAPTALFEVLRLMREEDLRPALVIGVPVGFVGAAESKQLLAAESPVPFITVVGNKGGSPIAAAAVNALLYLED